ncbi:MAG: SDR family oxidoreductase [Gammaproteobacteria bacterium]|nr:SDR family oxidoreductase [Gammaproteobacteria bacterium]
MSELFSLKGRVALVTGASGGLGRQFALTLSGAGASVVLAARRKTRLQQLAQEIESNGAKAVPVVMDVTNADSIRDGFVAAERAFGTVTILVNNSGIASATPALEIDEADWNRTMDTNLKGAWLVAQEAARHMVAAETHGSIINIVSILAFRVAKHLASYAASKAALLQLTRSLSLEWAPHKIRVNAIAPGYIITDMNRDFFQRAEGADVIKRIPQRRVGTPEDLDGALLLLASDASSYITGSTIVVDGGHLQSSL